MKSPSKALGSGCHCGEHPSSGDSRGPGKAVEGAAHPPPTCTAHHRHPQPQPQPSQADSRYPGETPNTNAFSHTQALKGSGPHSSRPQSPQLTEQLRETTLPPQFPGLHAWQGWKAHPTPCTSSSAGDGAGRRNDKEFYGTQSWTGSQGCPGSAVPQGTLRCPCTAGTQALFPSSLLGWKASPPGHGWAGGEAGPLQTWLVVLGGPSDSGRKESAQARLGSEFPGRDRVLYASAWVSSPSPSRVSRKRMTWWRS